MTTTSIDVSHCFSWKTIYKWYLLKTTHCINVNLTVSWTQRIYHCKKAIKQTCKGPSLFIVAKCFPILVRNHRNLKNIF